MKNKQFVITFALLLAVCLAKIPEQCILKSSGVGKKIGDSMDNKIDINGNGFEDSMRVF